MQAAGAGTQNTAIRGDTAPKHASGQQTAKPAELSKRQILEALSGLLLALFVAILSSTIVSNALPKIISDLRGTQSQYTWVVSASLLAMTSSTPIWGKLADLFSKKLLVQLSLIIFIIGSMLCGITQSTPELIAFRVLQGLGMGGLQALVQVVIATIIPPRERGRYTGYLGAVMALATVGGPLLGGIIVDTPGLGWRWCFYVTVPVAVVALIVLQKTLSVPLVKRKVKIDYLGSLLIAAGVSLLLIWSSLAGKQFDWWSQSSVLWAGGGLLSLILAVFVERRAAEPVVPPQLFADRTVVLSVIASFCVGIAMFGSTVFLTQYFQLGRGATPTHAGLMLLPMIAGLTISSTVVGQLISRYGKWKRYLVVGGVLLTAGMGLLALRLTAHLPYQELAVYMALLGMGLGMTMQNLVLAVQNTVGLANMGAASSTVAFFRSMGGAVGVSVLGAVLSSQVATHIADGLRGLGISGMGGAAGGQVPALDQLPPPVRDVVQDSYGLATAHLFAIAAPLAVLALLAILLIREVPLRDTVDIEKQPAGQAAPATAAEPVTVAAAGTRAETGPDAAPIRVAPFVSNGHGRNGHDNNGHETNGNGANGNGANGNGAHGPVLHGKVVRSDGGVPGSAWLTLTDLSGNQRARTISEPDGSYTLTTPGRDTYMLICAAAGMEPNAELITPVDAELRHDVVLGDGARSRPAISGTVRRDEQPVNGATVTVSTSDGRVVHTFITDRTGSYQVRSLPAGQYTVTASAAGVRPVAVTVRLSADGPLQQDLSLAAAVTLRGTVRTRHDQTAVGAVLATLTDETGTVRGELLTDEHGRFEFAELPAGSYTVTATSYPRTQAQVRLIPGEQREIEMALPSPEPGSPEPGFSAPDAPAGTEYGDGRVHPRY